MQARKRPRGIYFMVTHVDISSVLIRSKHCENESGDGIYPGRLYVSYHEVYIVLATIFRSKNVHIFAFG